MSTPPNTTVLRSAVCFEYACTFAALGVPTLSIELEYSPEPDRIGEWVAEAYTATDRLMREAGIRRG